VLAAAAVVTVVGEIVGPASLRACLRRAGEVPEPSAEAPAPSPAPPPDGAPEAPGAVGVEEAS